MNGQNEILLNKKLTLVILVAATTKEPLVLHLHVVGLSVDTEVWLILLVHVLGENWLPNLLRSLENILERVLLHY